MRNIINSLRTGDWLTRERMTFIPFAVLFASVVAVIAVIASLDGYLDSRGHPVGTDFANVYAAGTFVLEGRPDAPFDNSLQYARERELLGDSVPFYGWLYPPFFLFIAAVLALMPYGLALAVWQISTFLLYLVSIRAVLVFCTRQSSPAWHQSTLHPLWLLLAAAFPAVLINLGHGHNGFLTAALMGGALVLLDQRPAIAGILFGLLSYKPQFGLLIPLVLAATHRWRAFGSAAMTVAALALVTTLVFGPQVWAAFIDSTHFSRVIILEAGGPGFEKIHSVFAWVRMWGGSVELAYASQAIVMLAAAAMVVRLWRSDRPYLLKAGALIIASLLTTPYVLDYDMMTLAPAIAFLAMDGIQRGFGAGQKTALAMLWIAPLIARQAADYALLPVGVWAMIAALIISVRGRDGDQAAPAIAATQNTTHSRAV